MEETCGLGESGIAERLILGMAGLVSAMGQMTKPTKMKALCGPPLSLRFPTSAYTAVSLAPLRNSPDSLQVGELVQL